MGNMSNHFYIDKEYVDFFKEDSIILNKNRELGYLQRDNFILLACYGYNFGFKTDFKNPKTEGHDAFVMNQLDDKQLGLLYAIAIADTEELDVVNNDVEVANIAMGFANTRISELKTLEENSQVGNQLQNFRKEITKLFK